MSIEQIRHILLTIQYDGTDYAGWQVQKNGTTIQGVLEEALFTVSGERTRVTGAARTDAGVHAIEQVAVFSTASKLEAGVLLRALNANIPLDVRVISAEECAPGLHPRYSAKGKTYSYLISQAGPYSVFLKRYSWNMPHLLDADAMREASRCLIGAHDFACFRASGCSSKHPVRTITGIEIAELPGVDFLGFRFDAPFMRIRIKANAFLRHMARNIVGTLVDTGSGKFPPKKMEEILGSKDRRAAGRTAPACGLFLEKIEY